MAATSDPQIAALRAQQTTSPPASTAAAAAAAVAARVAAAAAAGLQGLGVPGLGAVQNEDIRVPDKMVGLSEYFKIQHLTFFKNKFENDLLYPMFLFLS